MIQTETEQLLESKVCFKEEVKRKLAEGIEYAYRGARDQYDKVIRFDFAPDVYSELASEVLDKATGLALELIKRKENCHTTKAVK